MSRTLPIAPQPLRLAERLSSFAAIMGAQQPPAVESWSPHEWPEAQKELGLGWDPINDICEAKIPNTPTSISASCSLTNKVMATGLRTKDREYFATAGGTRRLATVFVSYGGKTYTCLGSDHAMDLTYKSGLLDMPFAPTGRINITAHLTHFRVHG